MTSRDRILGKIRTGLAAEPSGAIASGAARRAVVEQHLAEPTRRLIPARVAGKPQHELGAILRTWLEAAGGHVIEAAAAQDVPGAIAGYLRSHNQPARVRIGTDARLGALPWAHEAALEVEHGPAKPTDTAGVTHALAAVAETGTVLVASGAENPVTLSFLPESNIVVVDRADIVGPLEDALARLRTRTGGLPRTLNMISGPSRSADIGGIPVLGAHGPKRLCVVVVGQAGSSPSNPAIRAG